MAVQSLDTPAEIDTIGPFRLIPDTQYLAFALGTATGGGLTLPDPQLSVVDAAGGALDIADDILAPGLDDFVAFAVPAAGDYHLRVSDAGQGTGVYDAGIVPFTIALPAGESGVLNIF